MNKTKECSSVIISIIMLTLCFASISTTVFAEEQCGIFTYEPYGNKAIITGVSNSASGDIVVPADLDGYTVDIIGSYAFGYKNGITSVVLPDTVTVIDDCAFYACSSMKSITLSNTLARIGEYAFFRCVTLQSLTIPDSVNEIKEYAFEHCENLNSVMLSQNLKSIAPGTFNSCYMLASVDIPESVEFIGMNAFDNTFLANNDENYEDGLLYVGKHLVKAKRDMAGRCSVREDTRSISQYAFLNCNEITSLAIHTNIKRIDKLAVLGCTKLKDIYYTGTVSDRRKISIPSNSSITALRWHCGYVYNPEDDERDPGDINGDWTVNNKDITRLFQHLSGWDVEVKNYVLDVNGDGKVNNKDITRLFQYLSGWNVKIFSDSVSREDFGNYGPIVIF